MPHDAHAPQLRTLLLTDLCDSTALVERLGDSAAATLYRDHDRLVLELQQRWRGRLIDRSDGLLLLFERPLDGLGFALDYRRGLDALGHAHRIGPMLARAGLHVGEVLIWRNSEEAVSAGAKPVEVEGLAKPFTARLMHLARPGQILLSSVVEPLVRRSVRELGERGHALQWRTHGRWLFKGVPEVQEVHEVGEPELAPLRAPRGDAKARREMPVWRRPLAVAAEVVVVTGLVVGGWFMTRPEPAIAFSERDWVVVGDLRNLTGQTVLDDSLEQAFRISLEQSRYVNVLSDLKVRNTLARMERDPETTAVDRNIGSEVAMRDGARLLILPTVAEVGGRVRFSVEVVDPNSQRTLIAQSSDGRGMASALGSIDAVTASLRNALGEEVTSVSRDSAPLPDVTTSNLDALRAYALGQKAFGESRYRQAKGFYQRAVELDPKFGLAYIGLLKSSNAQMEIAEGKEYLSSALKLRYRLPPRDQLYLDAWNAEVNDPTATLEKWKQVAELYPDYFPAFANVAHSLHARNRYSEGLKYASKAVVPQNGFSALSTSLVGQLRLGMDEPEEATQAFAEAVKEGAVTSVVGLANSYAAQRNFEKAAEAWPTQSKLTFPYFDRVSAYIDQGRWDEAISEANERTAQATQGSLREELGQIVVASALLAAGRSRESLSVLPQAIDNLLARQADSTTPRVDAEDAAYAAMMGALIAQRMGDRKLAATVLKQLKPWENDRDRPHGALYSAVAANQLRISGDPGEAVSMLEKTLDGAEPLQVRQVLLEAYADMGRADDALAQAAWLAEHRGRAYAELGCARCQQPMNVYDTVASHLRAAEILASSNRVDEAKKELTRLDDAWSNQDEPDYLRRRRGAVVATFN